MKKVQGLFSRSQILQWMLNIRVEKEQKFRELGYVPNEEALNNTFKVLTVRLRRTEVTK